MSDSLNVTGQMELDEGIVEFLSMRSCPFKVEVRHDCFQPLVLHGVTIDQNEDGDIVLNIPPDQGWILAHIVNNNGDILLRLEE